MNQHFFRNYISDILLISLIVICTAVIYYPVRFFDFISLDDQLYILDNTFIQNGLNWDSLIWAFSTTRGGSWHPLTWISHMMDISWYGLDSGGHHWSNVQIHIVSTILLFIFFRMTLTKIWISAAIATCFALHPLHVESVAWISERKDVLSVFWAHLTLVAYVWYTVKKSLYRQLMVLFCFCFSLMSKPMMITMPILFCVIDYWPLNRWRNYHTCHLFKEKVLFVIPAIIIAILTVISQKTEGAMTATYELPFYYQLLNAGTAYCLYLGKIFVPIGLSIFYPHPGVNLSVFYAFCSWLFIMSVTWIAISCRKQFPFVFTGTIWFLLTLLPVIGIIQVGSQQMADRYTYFPMTGITIVFLMGLLTLFQKFPIKQKATKFLLFAILLSCLSLATYKQVYIWQDNSRLFQHALDHTALNTVAHIGLADDYMKKNHILIAIDHYKKALHINPHHTNAWLKLAKAYKKIKKYHLALAAYEKILVFDPDCYDAHVNSGNLFAQNLHQYEQAMAHYLIALSQQSDDPVLLTNMGNIEKEKGCIHKAIQWYFQAIRSDDSYLYSFVNLAILIDTSGSQTDTILEQCVNQFKQMKKASFYFDHLSHIFETNQKKSLALFFKQKARIYGKH